MYGKSFSSSLILGLSRSGHVRDFIVWCLECILKWLPRLVFPLFKKCHQGAGWFPIIKSWYYGLIELKVKRKPEEPIQTSIEPRTKIDYGFLRISLFP
ncbi:hypothetical protein VNO77_23085 [Canavalia gladiata]|uniref:Uncharacterized protein n=1 Tax=Canavalia gladiata TaxID=3824 RepID=A0AAN9L3Z2_CANGL